MDVSPLQCSEIMYNASWCRRKFPLKRDAACVLAVGGDDGADAPGLSTCYTDGLHAAKLWKICAF